MTIINHCRGTETKESCSYASLFVSIGNNNSISEKHRWCPCRLTSYRFASFSSMSRLESVAPHINSSKGRVRGKVSPVLSRASRAASLAPPVRPGADHAANANFSCEKAGMLSLALVLGPWLSLRTKLQSLVLALALNLQSLVLALALKVSPWSWP